MSYHLGGLFFRPRVSTETYETIGENQKALMYGGAVGFEYIIRKQVGVKAEIGIALTSSDELDNLISGAQNDGYSYVSIGIGYFFSLGRRVR